MPKHVVVENPGGLLLKLFQQGKGFHCSRDEAGFLDKILSDACLQLGGYPPTPIDHPLAEAIVNGLKSNPRSKKLLPLQRIHLLKRYQDVLRTIKH